MPPLVSSGMRTQLHRLHKVFGRVRSSLSNLVFRYVSLAYPSTNIFEEDWDAMVILDACRYDLMLEVAPEFEYLPAIDETYSVGSKTTEWMDRTFTDSYRDTMAETAYVTGNPNSEKFLNSDQFTLLDEVWRYSWDDEIGTIPMEPITDRAILVGRSTDASRLLVHYMQPHEPFLSAPELGGSDTVKRKTGEATDTEFRSVWSRLKAGEISEERVWKHYRENLRRILANLELLVDNLDAEQLIITSDHGNAFGELGYYGHPPYRPTRSLRRVPWIELSTSDSGTYEPDNPGRRQSSDVDSRLRDLGYL